MVLNPIFKYEKVVAMSGIYEIRNLFLNPLYKDISLEIYDN